MKTSWQEDEVAVRPRSRRPLAARASKLTLVEHFKNRYRRYAGVILWLTRELWSAVGLRLLWLIASEGAARVLNLAAFLATVNVVIWILLERSRLSLLFDGLEHPSGGDAYLLAAMAGVPVLFLVAGAVRYFANDVGHECSLRVARQVTWRYLRARAEGLLAADASQATLEQQFRELANKEEDKVYNACIASITALITFLAGLTVSLLAIFVAFLLEPVTIGLFMPFVLLFGALYVLVSYRRTRHKKQTTETVQRGIKEHRAAMASSFSDVPNSGQLEEFLSSYGTVYDELASMANARRRPRMLDDLWRQLFAALGIGLVVFIIYARREEIELSLFTAMVFVFVFRFGVMNLIGSFTQLSVFNGHYTELYELRRVTEQAATDRRCAR